LSYGDAGPFTLTENGFYRLIIDGVGARTGDYSFNLLEFSQATPIAPDTQQSGQLSPGQETHLYSFTGTVGQRLYFDSSMNSSGLWTLYDSGNQEVGRASLNSDFEVSLAQTGTYVLVLQGNTNEAVDYQFQVITPEITTTTLTLGSPVSHAISEKGEQDIYTFKGSAGQRLFLDTLTNAGYNIHYLSLISPSGLPITTPSGEVLSDRDLSYGDAGPFTLTENGFYRLIIDGVGARTGDYSFQVTDLAMASSLNLDAPTSDSLPPQTVRFYQFNGTIGQRLQFDSLSAVSGADWVLYGTGNVVLGSASLSSDFEVELINAGPCFLALRNPSGSPINYAIQVNTLASLVVSNTGFGSVYSGISTSAPTTQTFTASAGTLVYFDSQSSSPGVAARLLDPKGNQIFDINASGDSGAILLKRSGTYTLQLAGNGYYQYQMIDLGTATDLTLNTITNATFEPTTATTVYKFTGTFGQQLYYDALNINYPNVVVQLVTPTGHVLFSNGAQYDRDLAHTLTLNEAGTYYLLFSGNQAATSNVSFQLLNKADAQLITLDQEVPGQFTDSRQSNLYRFTGSVGQAVYVNQQVGSYNEWYLFGPGGKLVSNSNLYSDQEFPLPADGEYLLVLRGTDNSPSNYKFTLVTPFFDSKDLLFNQTVSGTLLEPGENDTYTFTGTPGQQLFFDALSGNDFRVKLYDPIGREVFNASSRYDRGPDETLVP
jgi:hypothetical protein